MNLSDRERAMLVLDKRFCWSRSSFDNVLEWNECQNELKHYCIDYYDQKKVHEKEKNIKLKNEQS